MYTLKGKDPATVKIASPKYTPPDVKKRDKHEDIYKQVTPQLLDVEKKMSSGGSQILTYTHDLQVNVGAQYVGADVAPSVSVVNGYPVPAKVSIGKQRTEIHQKITPHIQSIPQSIPWGTYGIMAGNKFNVVVGSGGIMMHTDGCIDITSGGRTTISSLYELNLTSSSGNLNIICGNNINIRGDTVCIRTAKQSDQVVVDSSLGVSRNLTVHGSTYIDGELYCQHITAPAVARITSASSTPEGSIIGWAIVPGHGRCPVIGDPSFLAHTHAYYTLASDLHTGNGAVRDAASVATSSGDAGVAKSQTHGGTGLVS